jgi:hypothetical protein
VLAPQQLCLRIGGCIGLERMQLPAPLAEVALTQADSQPWTVLYYCFPVHVDTGAAAGGPGIVWSMPRVCASVPHGVNVHVHELRLGFSNTTWNPEGILRHNNRKG